MKTITFYLCLFLMSCGMQVTQAQDQQSNPRIEQLKVDREKVIAEEKEALKKAVEDINKRLEARDISRSEADQLKEEAAKKHALNIENRVAIIDNEIAWLSRNDDVEGEEKKIVKVERKNNYGYKNTYNRTSSQLVVAAGFNNALYDGQSLNDSDFKIAGSRFFEIGVAWRTRVFNNTNFLRLRYGVSFQLNGLKPTDNRYFVEDGDLTVLTEYPVELDKSKFRMDNLVFPLHFEFGPSNKAKTDWGTWFSAEDHFRIGIGGFAGFNIGERQKLKYEENGDDVKVKLKNSYNTNDLVYGLSAYIGWGDTSLYAKYDLNPIFKDPNREMRNISLGLRFDLD